MSQPRRRRRRRRKPNREQGPGAQASSQAGPGAAAGGGQRSRRRKRGAATSGGDAARQVSSEDLVRRSHTPRPRTLTAPPDGQKLEDIISELQSVWGVPQYPQEYRLTLKVAEERETRPARRAPARGDGSSQTGAPASSVESASEAAQEAPKREKAPAAPRIGGASPDGEETQGEAPARRKRSRRRRRGKKSN